MLWPIICGLIMCGWSVIGERVGRKACISIRDAVQPSVFPWNNIAGCPWDFLWLIYPHAVLEFELYMLIYCWNGI